MMTVVRPRRCPLGGEAGGASASGDVEAWHDQGASGSGGFYGQVMSGPGGVVDQTALPGNGGVARVDAAAWAGGDAFGSERPFFEVPAWRRQVMRKERGDFKSA
jgi:hypothetical protein